MVNSPISLLSKVTSSVVGSAELVLYLPPTEGIASILVVLTLLGVELLHRWNKPAWWRLSFEEFKKTPRIRKRRRRSSKAWVTFFLLRVADFEITIRRRK